MATSWWPRKSRFWLVKTSMKMMWAMATHRLPAYEIELAASPDDISPRCFARYPVGQPIEVTGTFQNDGITDATNTPATATTIAW